MPPLLKIALTGAQGTGKSTLLRSIALRLPHLTPIPEQAREVMQEWGELAQNMTPQRLAEFQEEIMRRHLAAETVAHSFGFVADRCVIDNLAYAQGLSNYQTLKDISQAHLSTQPYTHIFLVKKMFPPKHDGLRDTNEIFQEEIERRIIQLLTEFQVPYHTITAFGKQERVEEVLSLIQ